MPQSLIGLSCLLLPLASAGAQPHARGRAAAAVGGRTAPLAVAAPMGWMSDQAALPGTMELQPAPSAMLPAAEHTGLPLLAAELALTQPHLETPHLLLQEGVAPIAEEAPASAHESLPVAREAVASAEKAAAPLTDRRSRDDVGSGRLVFDLQEVPATQDGGGVLAAPSSSGGGGTLFKAAAAAAALTLAVPGVASAGDGASPMPVAGVLMGAIVFLGGTLGAFFAAKDHWKKGRRVLSAMYMAGMLLVASMGVGWIAVGGDISRLQGRAQDAAKVPAQGDIAKLQAAVDKAEAEAQDPAARDWISRLASPDAETRSRSLRELSELQTEDVRPAIMAASAALAHDPDRSVRYQAAQALRWLGRQQGRSAAALDALARAASDDPAAGVRSAALEGLIGVLEDPKAAPETVQAVAAVLRRAMHQDGDAGVRRGAAWRISSLGERALPSVLDLRLALAKDPDLRVRAAAAESLLRLGQAADIDVLMSDLFAEARGDGATGRAAAANDLRWIAVYSADAALRRSILELLARLALEDPDRSVRSRAIDSIYWLNSLPKEMLVQGALPALRKALVREADAKLRDDIRQTIARIEGR